MSNIILMTDSYKHSHWKQYPKGTSEVYSYFESRGGDFQDTTFFGLQYFIKKYLMGQVVTQEKVDEAAEIVEAHMGPGAFNREGWEYIVREHNGYLPVEIKAVREGSVVPTKNVLMTVRNTDSRCFWLTNFLETLLVQVWYPSTVATQSRHMKKKLRNFWEMTSNEPESTLDFKLHDFGYRGVTTPEQAGLGGCAHLINFKGTDTMEALMVARRYYGADMPGFSIPASEHSTITSWGQEHEVDAMANMLEQYPTGLVACVSDSYNIWDACSELWGKQLKDKVLGRDGVLVVRPDSGHPPDVVCEVLRRLGDAFGTTTNSKGYKVLNPKVRVIQGDGIDFQMLNSIIYAMTLKGWSVDNIAFGSGGGLLQKMNRDTSKYAFKCSSITVNGKEQDVYKDPITAPGKVSKKGKLDLVREWGAHGSVYKTVKQGQFGRYDTPELHTVFRNGRLLRELTWNEVAV